MVIDGESLTLPESCLSSAAAQRYPERQWPRVHRHYATGLISRASRRALAHRAGQPVGERLLRKFQRQAAERMLERGDFLFAEGGPDRDRELESGVQHAAAALVAALPSAGAGGIDDIRFIAGFYRLSEIGSFAIVPANAVIVGSALHGASNAAIVYFEALLPAGITTFSILQTLNIGFSQSVAVPYTTAGLIGFGFRLGRGVYNALKED